MLTYDVVYIDVNGETNTTRLNIEEYNRADVETVELINLILNLKDEIGLKKVLYIDYIDCEDEED